MNTKGIDVANIILMIVSCILAYLVPFELFLFSYAILGPLHYLTEINWLKQRNFFTNNPTDYMALLVLGFLLFFLVIVFKNPQKLSVVIILLAFSMALASVIFTKLVHKILFVLITSGMGVLIKLYIPSAYLLAGLFLPTIIHVFIFTGIFILYGAMKNKSRLGYFSILVFLFCAGIFFFYSPNFQFYQASHYARNTITNSGFDSLNISLVNLLQLGDVTKTSFFESDAALAVMRFIAFAYTYHYLNWFSKTEVIKWHKVPKVDLAFILMIWAASVGTYIYDYRTGLITLYMLSILHVILEFPLNYRSIIGVGKEFKTVIKAKRKPVMS